MANDSIKIPAGGEKIQVGRQDLAQVIEARVEEGVLRNMMVTATPVSWRRPSLLIDLLRW